LAVFALALLLAPFAQAVRADSARSREYQVKAAFLYNFIKFAGWPEEKLGDGNEPIIIGIIGKDPFRDSFKPLEDKQVKGKNVVIKRFRGFEEPKESDKKDKSVPNEKIEAIRKCHLLFICSSEQANLKEIVHSVKEHSVLTVGDVDGFLEGGGIINLLMEEHKLRFEVNCCAAKTEKLEIRSKLLRLAKRVVEEEPQEEQKS
jgi:hypothetical protein